MSRQVLDRPGSAGAVRPTSSVHADADNVVTRVFAKEVGAPVVGAAEDMIGRAYEDGLPEAGSVTSRDETVTWSGFGDLQNRMRAKEMLDTAYGAGSMVVTRRSGEVDFTPVRQGGAILDETEVVAPMSGG